MKPYLSLSFAPVMLFLFVQAALGQAWLQLAPSGALPNGRVAAYVVFSPASNRLIVFGGYAAHTTSPYLILNDLWILTGANGTGTAAWQQVYAQGAAGSPSPREGGTAVYDPSSNRMIIFGGDNDTYNTPAFNDVWVLANADGTGGTPTWTQLFPANPPPGLTYQSSEYDPATNRLIVFGGISAPQLPFTFSNDVWVLTNANGTEATPPAWIHLSPSGALPSARFCHMAGFDPTQNELIVYGGRSSNAGLGFYPDTWVLRNANGSGGTPAWTQLSPSGQPVQGSCGLSAYDPASQRLIVFSGSPITFPDTNATFVLTNALGGGSPAWQQLNPSGSLPLGRDQAGGAYDQVHNELVMFAGEDYSAAGNGITLNDTWVLTSANGIVAQQISVSQLFPNHGGNAGTVTVQVIGSGFQSAASATLTGLGPDIIGANTNVPNPSVLVTTFDLTGATPGVGSVVITNPDGTTATLAGAFTVEQGGAPQVWVDIVGRNTIRIGSPQTYYVLVGNSGNVDSAPGLVSLGVPASLQFTQQSGSNLFMAGSTSDPEFAIAAPSGDPSLLFATPGVPAGQSQAAPVQLTLPVGAPVSFTLTAGSQKDLANLSLDDFLGLEQIPFIPFPAAGCDACQDKYNAETFAYSSLASPYRAYQTAKGDADLAVAKLTAVFGFTVAGLSVGALDIPPLAALGLGAGISLIDACVEHIVDDDRCLPSVDDWLKTTKSAIIGCLPPSPVTNCLGGVTLPRPAVTALDKLDKLLDLAISAYDYHVTHGDAIEAEKGAFQQFQQALTVYQPARAAYQSCLSPQTCAPLPPLAPPPPPPGNTLPVQGVSSGDPNDKVGAQGAGVQQYITGATPLRYSVFFGNQDTATAPAQSVSITDQLDTTSDNLATLSLGPITFGSQSISPLPFQTDFLTTVDLRPATNLLVGVNASLDSNGLLTWNFQSLDPSTMQPPTDPTLGFLPPGVGGSAFFTVMPKQGLATNTQIQNQATIVFDANPPMSTPTWLNTLDNTPPISHVNSLPATESCPNFKVSWSGSDVGSGTKSFTVFYSDNGGPFTAWLTDTASTADTFQGQLGHSYTFYSIAQDLVGNAEPAMTTAEATTQVGSAAKCGPPSLSGKAAVGSFSGGVLTITLRLTDSGSGDAQDTLINKVTFRTLGGTGAVTLTSPALPISVGNISVGAATTETLTLNVPSTVTKFSITEAGTLQNAAGTTYNFSIGQVVLP